MLFLRLRFVLPENGNLPPIMRECRKGDHSLSRLHEEKARELRDYSPRDSEEGLSAL
jgi:hypothetical protein